MRNLAQLLHSLRVAPKSLTSLLPDVLEGCRPMRASAQAWLLALGDDPRIATAKRELAEFFPPRIDELEEALREASLRPMNAKTRLTLEDAVAKSSFELDAGRELLELLEHAVFARPVRLDPRELVREAFTSPPSARAEGRALVSATLSSHDAGGEIEISPRVAMVLVAFGVEMVGAGPGRETPHVLIASDRQSMCSVRVTRQAHATGEPLVLASRGVIEPTLASLKAAAAMTGGSIEWEPNREEFELTYSLAEPALARETAS